MLNGCYLLPNAEFYVAVDNRCLWPNLKILSSREIGAIGYDHPSHGGGCGNVELWVSSDEGKFWTWRSTVSDHSDEPKDLRLNHAVGITKEGDYLALVGGWKHSGATHLPIQVCISKDNGYTWDRHELETAAQPFGDIVLSPDGKLTCGFYQKGERTDGRENLYRITKRLGSRPTNILISSRDHGKTWGEKRVSSNSLTEAALLRCKNSRWLAAVRTWQKKSEVEYLSAGEHLKFYKSTDEGYVWSESIQISLPGQHPASLLELNDGKILLTYGSRIEGLFGIVMKLSENGGDSWSKPYTLISVPNKVDCGYPSSIQLKDGTIITGYYISSTPWHSRYHMGIARWRVEDLGNIVFPIVG
jgi:hypothetical protein